MVSSARISSTLSASALSAGFADSNFDFACSHVSNSCAWHQVAVKRSISTAIRAGQVSRFFITPLRCARAPIKRKIWIEFVWTKKAGMGYALGGGRFSMELRAGVA